MKRSMMILACSAALFSASAVQAIPVTFSAILNGASEAPPNASPGTGFATVVFDTESHTMQVKINFSGLLGTTTAAHIHCCTPLPNAGVAGIATVTPTFTGFPTGVTTGSYDHLFDMTSASSYNAAFITFNGGTAASAESVLFNGMFAERSYVNIHTTQFPGGEIRGFLQQVPEPGSLALLGLGLAGLGWSRRQRRMTAKA